jgi:peptidoglycan/LPS O-acetylase OafA/YrhL
MGAVTVRGDGRYSPGRIPGLDGLRGVAVFAVLLYHGGFTSMRGGFLGVSTFFTLSGFLIASLLLAELQSDGAIQFRRFWTRRARRLLPAALFTLGAIVVFRHGLGEISPARLRGDVVAALGYVENWWLLHNKQTYGALFGVTSPVQHFWSLAIEEQYYLLFPIVCYALHRVLRRTTTVAIVFGIAAIGSLVLAGIFSTGADVTRAYYGTDTRASELLVGVVVAYLLFGRDRKWSRPTALALDVAGFAALVALACMWSRIDLQSSLLFHGGTALNAVCTAAVIVACVHGNALAAVLSIAPLRLLGRISYGVYLIHWPIFLWLNPARIRVGTTELFALRVALTVAIAAVLFVVVERPIRINTLLPGVRFSAVVLPGIAAVVIGSLLMTSTSRPVIDLASASPVHGQLGDLSGTKPPAGDARVLLVGDSLGWTVWVGLNEWGLEHRAEVGRYTAVGCGIGGPGVLRYLGVVRPTFEDCAAWHRTLPTAVKLAHPDIVVVVMGLADVAPRRFPGNRFLSIGDPVFDRWFSTRIESLDRALASTGARVVWATYPHVDVRYSPGSTGSPPFPENDRKRIDHLNALIARIVRSNPGLSLVDFAAYCRRRPGGEFDPSFRPDGVHLDGTSTREVAAWLGPQLLNRR